MKIDFSKPVEIRDGREVRIYATESTAVVGAPIVGEYYTATSDGGCWTLARWGEDGRRHLVSGVGDSHSSDLINVPEEHTIFVSIYPRNSARVYQTSNGYLSKDDTVMGSSGRIACVKVMFKDGEGLE